MIQHEINQHLLEWDKIAVAFRESMTLLAERENAYRRARAKFIIKIRDADPKLSQSAAETFADADDDVMVARLWKEQAAADVEAFRQKLFWCRAKSDALRSEKVDEREANRLHADHPAGA